MKQKVDYELIGRRVKAIRLKKGLTQSGLAKLVGCNPSHISNIERNHVKASVNVIFKIATVLDTTVGNLIFATDRDDQEVDYDYQIIKGVSKLSDDQKRLLIQIIENL